MVWLKVVVKKVRNWVYVKLLDFGHVCVVISKRFGSDRFTDGKLEIGLSKFVHEFELRDFGGKKVELFVFIRLSPRFKL